MEKVSQSAWWGGRELRRVGGKKAKRHWGGEESSRGGRAPVETSLRLRVKHLGFIADIKE